MPFGIYLIIGPDQKLYVGVTSQSVTERFHEHKKNAQQGIERHLYRAMRKYGADEFDAVQIDAAPNKKEAYELEKHWISRLATYSGRGYNMTNGGENPPTMTGPNHPRHGKSHSDKALKQISESLSGENNPWFGKTGENAPNAKISRKYAAEVKWLAANSDLTQKEIAQNYEINQGTVSRIKREERWPDLESKEPKNR